MITREDLIVNTKLLYKSTMRVMAKNTVQKTQRYQLFCAPSEISVTFFYEFF